MIVEKVLNNNVVVSIDPKLNKEVILMGNGIAFNKKVGQSIDEDKIEKVFIVDNQTLGNKVKKLIDQIPDGIFQLSYEIINYSIQEFEIKVDKQIYISLADHIAFALRRYRKKIAIKNDLLDEIRRVHKNEFKVALWAVNYINEKLNVELPEDEAGFIALHFVNASLSGNTTDSIISTKIIRDILDIIKDYYDMEFKEDDLSYDRLLTHLKYFAKRIITNDHDNGEDETFIKMVSTSYPQAYDCSLRIKQYIVDSFQYKVNPNEIVYLTMHIQRVIAVAREKN